MEAYSYQDVSHLCELELDLLPRDVLVRKVQFHLHHLDMTLHLRQLGKVLISDVTPLARTVGQAVHEIKRNQAAHLLPHARGYQ